MKDTAHSYFNEIDKTVQNSMAAEIEKEKKLIDEKAGIKETYDANQLETDQERIQEFFEDLADFIIFLQTIGLFYSAGIDFGFIDIIAAYTEFLSFGFGNVSSIGSFIVSVGYAAALLYLLKYFRRYYAAEEEKVLNQREMRIYFAVQVFCFLIVLVERISCGVIVISSIALIIFAFAHFKSFKEWQLELEIYKKPMLYTYQKFFSFLAIPVVSIIMTAIIDAEGVNETTCYSSNLPEFGLGAFILPIIIVCILLVIYHMILADIDWKQSPEKYRERAHRKLFVAYGAFEITERIIVAIITQGQEEEVLEEIELTLNYLILQYALFSVSGFIFAYGSDFKRRLLTLCPRIAVLGMLWFGKSLNELNQCIQEIEQLSEDGNLTIIYYDYQEIFDGCFDLNGEDVALSEIEAIELSRLDEEKFGPALIILLIAILIAGIWFYYLSPIEALKAWRRFNTHSNRSKSVDSGVSSHNSLLLEIANIVMPQQDDKDDCRCISILMGVPRQSKSKDSEDRYASDDAPTTVNDA